MTRTKLPAELYDADPVRAGAPEEITRLTALRADVDARRLAVAAPPSVRPARPRRGLPAFGALAAGVVTMVLAAVVVVPALWPGDSDSAPFIDAAIAADGSLQCGNGGFNAPVRPDRSSLRLWPTTLPQGWRVVTVAATSNRSMSACFTPSLVATALAGDGVVTGRLTVTGPARGIDSAGDAAGADDVVAGHKATRFTGVWPDTYSWLWSDRAGRQWYAEVTGYPLDRAKAVVAGVGTKRDEATWRADAAPEMKLLDRRTGAPYPRERRNESWMLTLTDGRQDRSISFESGNRPLISRAYVGDRVGQLAGHTEVVGTNGGEQTFLRYEPLPGVWANPTAVYGDLADVRTVMAGLRVLPSDDERLDRYAAKD
ncbi:hypothetical protein GCM10010168_17260 [Actinoplanes ianthinogenes]|uniref:Uncharacterized protein n=1 Tax=Actinoplanes ianthinogenes TaxID=122358 RepID=A0ABM7M706_9ACTN|nr:hypothetical protein [Actinoplanes ianthinogenes]BCJ47368.1 hypothetical protein Aiant_80250 [Actinoplanes ianthinogenes]GGR01337.1 hypothetical protein GCM10010168_17260 [Actinoplanes ianthinogenes]